MYGTATLLNRWPKTGLLSVLCQKFGIKLKAIRGPQLGSYPVLGPSSHARFYEWFPLIHLLFDSIKPVGGVGRGNLVDDCMVKGTEAPIFFGGSLTGLANQMGSCFGLSGACLDLTPLPYTLECL